MLRVRDLMVLAGVVLLGVFVQVLLVAAEIRETPIKGAEAFAGLYYRLDPAMTDRMCQDLAAQEELVDRLIHDRTQEAQARGVGLNYMKFQLFHLRTSLLSQEADKAGHPPDLRLLRQDPEHRRHLPCGSNPRSRAGRGALEGLRQPLRDGGPIGP